jgi:hypothetical protein
MNLKGNLMVETLPITIHASDELLEKLTKLRAIISRFEAQFNFQTMTANWYGDEDNIINIALCLRMPDDFSHQASLAQKMVDKKEIEQQLHKYSDDAFSVFDKKSRQLICTIAVTASELTLLDQQEKLLTPYLQKKTHKILNLIAAQLSLPTLTA